KPATSFYCCPLLTTLCHIIGWFPCMSRGNVRFFEKSCENLQSLDQPIRAAAGCGSFSRRLQFLVVVFFASLFPGRRSPIALVLVFALASCATAIPFRAIPCYAVSRVCVMLTPRGASTMEWTTPQHEEIDLNCEVSSYANAEL